jgi:hypothetical protein
MNYMMSKHIDIPDDLVFLLSNEEKNISNIKKNQKNKTKAENDFAVFRTKINPSSRSEDLSAD